MVAKQLPRGVIGVVHVGPMPGDPNFDGSGLDDVVSAAQRDAEALAEGGAAAIIVENFGSTPFRKGDRSERLEPHTIAAMTLIVRACQAAGVSVGVNCLRNDAPAALGIAAATGADFIRVNVHTGAYVTDQGLIEGEAHHTLRYRQRLGAERVAILADVHVKHARQLVATSLEEALADTVKRGLADGVIITGTATGAPIDPAMLARAHAQTLSHKVPLYAGSGVTEKNIATLLPYVDGVIVGTWLKEDGRIHAPVDVDRVRRIVQHVNEFEVQAHRQP